MSDVISLAEEDTQLHKVAVNEYAGVCPGCGGTDRFRVRYSRETGTWSFLCRSCWDAGQYLPDKGRKRGWGDAIDYLRHYRGLTFQEAKSQIIGQETPVRHHERYQPRYLTQEWQAATHKAMQAHTARLWSADTLALEYARQRGFYDHTIKQFQLGYSLHHGLPYLVIPSINGGQYVTVYRRDCRADVPKGQRWKDAPGGTKDELYLADCLWLRKELPVVLCEDAFSALSIYQECGDLVNVVATGGAECGLSTRWIARLACMPIVLIALDADAAGDKYAAEWGRRLKNAHRLRPLLKDANDMLMASWDLREWILNGLEGADDDLVQKGQESLDVLHCSVCGVDAERLSVEEFCSFDELGQVFCPGCWQKRLDSKNYPCLQQDFG
ncbi:MAG: toprim domain-containing protein [Ktedonobacteraceae bacterium]|nr:toprim domain-containing protein [Ktedonobacteraceae bacterium]